MAVTLQIRMLLGYQPSCSIHNSIGCRIEISIMSVSPRSQYNDQSRRLLDGTLEERACLRCNLLIVTC